LAILGCLAASAAAAPFLGTAPLEANEDLALEMVRGIHRYLDAALDGVVQQRESHWRREFSSPEDYTESVQPNRDRLARMIGVVDERVPVSLQWVATTDRPAKIAETGAFEVFSVRWPVLEGVHGEGLLLEPKGGASRSVVALPDCDWTPEM